MYHRGVAVRDALLVADQHFDLVFPPLIPSIFAEAERTSLDWKRQEFALLEREIKPLPSSVSGIPARGSTSVEVHLRGAQHALAQLERRMQRDRESRQELRWLAENRRRFSGRWIALEGDQLLAVGNTAKQVFLQVADRPRPPLVIRIDDRDLPFAGW